MDVRFYGNKGACSHAASPLVLHFHAGAFVAGSLESGAAIPRLLVEAGAVVISLDYPLAPGHPFPEAIEAGYAALLWAFKARGKLAGKQAQVFVAGEEAGGNIAAAVALMSRDQHQPQLAGQILLSPMLDPCMATASLRCADAGPVGCTWADGWHKYLSRLQECGHPYAAPGTALRLADLPPTLVLTAEDDPLRDEALAYVNRLREAGRLAHVSVLPGPTGWPASFVDTSDRKKSWSPAVLKELKTFLAGSAARRTASALIAGDSGQNQPSPISIF
ncbi:MAG: alpha/beta hydrolase [Pseudomonadota bacterium]